MENCWECNLAVGKVKPDVNVLIELDENWLLNHYGGKDTFLGRLILQPRKHHESFADFSLDEFNSIGRHIKAIDKHLRTFWARNFSTDLIQRLYIVSFSEGGRKSPHLHFHLIPRTEKIGKLLEVNGFVLAWDIYKINRYRNLPTEYFIEPQGRNETAIKLMRYLKKCLP